jgi:outer membrane protein TolC
MRTYLQLGLVALCLLAAGPRVTAQEAGSLRLDYSETRGVFPFSFKPYQNQPVVAPELRNSPAVANLVTDGAVVLSLPQLYRAVVENSLAIDNARYTLFVADTDLLRAKAGQAARGTTAARIPSSLGSLNFGAGGTGNSASNARTVNVTPRGTFDPALTFNFSLDTTTSPLNSTRVTGVPSVVTHTSTLQTRYAQLFDTGTSFSFHFNVQRQSSTSRNQRFNPSLATNYNLSLNQQLLSGFSRDNNRRYIRVAETNREAARQAFALEVMAAVAQAEGLYWDLVAAKERVRAAEQSLAVSSQLLRDTRRQVEIGTMAPLEVVSAEAEVAGRRRDLIQGQTGVQQAALQLKNAVVRQMDDALAAAGVQTTDTLPEPQDSDVPAFEEAFAAALRNRPELAQAAANIRNQEIAVEFTKDRLKPTLSVFALLSSQGRAGTVFDSWSDVGRLNFPEYAYGFSLSFSIGNRAAQADHTEAQLNRQQSELSLQRTRNTIRQEVRNTIIGVMQAKAAVAAADTAVERSRQTLDAEQRKLRAGTSTSYNVIQIQRDLFTAELAEVQARVAYARARVALDRATGTILERRGIDLDQVIASPAAFTAP